MDSAVEQIVLFLTGFVANVLASMTGGGAGFVQLPVLIFMGLSFSAAIGTHKVAVVALGLGSLARNHRADNLSLPAALVFLLAGCPAVAAGSVFVVGLSDRVAEFSLGIITLASVGYSAAKKKFGLENREDALTARDYVKGVFFTALAGFMSGSFSSGAGLIAIMVLVACFRMDIKKAIHHSMILVAFVWNLVGAATVGALAQITWAWVPALVAGAFIGGFTGTYLLNFMNVKRVKVMFQSVMALSGLMLLWKAAAG